MSASKKTIHELEAELKKLQLRIEKLKKRIADAQTKSDELNAPQPRKKLHSNLEFIGDFDLIKAKVVNVSDSGICFKTKVNLPFEMRYQHDGQTVNRRAYLIWLKHEIKSGYVFGLKFVNKKNKRVP